jgi:hypothetical protein
MAKIFMFDPAKIKGSVLRSLQIRAIKVGLCPFCRTKSLESINVRVIEDHAAIRCTECARVFMV